MNGFAGMAWMVGSTRPLQSHQVDEHQQQKQQKYQLKTHKCQSVSLQYIIICVCVCMNISCVS